MSIFLPVTFAVVKTLKNREAKAESLVLQRQAIARVDQQTVYDAVSPLEESPRVVVQWKARCVHRPAVEMIDSHGDLPRPRSSQGGMKV